MIYGNLRTWQTDKHYFPSIFSRTFAFMETSALAEKPVGRHPLEGDDIVAMVNETTTEAESRKRFELHDAYLDIHLLLSGREKQLYAPEPADRKTGLLEDALLKDDIAFYSLPVHYNTLILEPGDYAIYLPGELHCPCCAVEEAEPVRKIVFKILASRIKPKYVIGEKFI